jgi:hypothetical protein
MTPPLYPLKFAGSKAQKKDFRVTSGQNSSHEGEAPSRPKSQRTTEFVALAQTLYPARPRAANHAGWSRRKGAEEKEQKRRNRRTLNI